METNTVVLTLKEYNELRDFQKEIERGVVVARHYISASKSYEYVYYGADEPVKQIADVNKKLNKEIIALNDTANNRAMELEGLKIKNNDLMVKNEESERTLSRLKKMTIWEFRRWKRTNKKKRKTRWLLTEGISARY